MKENQEFPNTSYAVPPIPTYIINLKKREDRRQHIINEFSDRPEFSLKIVEAFEHTRGSLGLWMTIRHILQDRVSGNDEYIIIGEDDVEFTGDYSANALFRSIGDAQKRGLDVMLGGVSWFYDAIHISNDLFWTNNFSGLQFTVIFKKFFPVILGTRLRQYVAADYYLASLTRNASFIYPFITVQKEFGYSDATPKNNREGRVVEIFEATSERLTLLKYVKDSYNEMRGGRRNEHKSGSFERMMISTYIINLPERTERLEHIKEQFEDKPEFDVKIIAGEKHQIGALGLWLSIRKAVKLAIENDDDVIVICEDDHEFTEAYTKDFFFKNVIEAHLEGASILSGGSGQFGNIVPLTKNRYWVAHCLSTQFVVIFRGFFQKILDEPYDDTIVADLAYSGMTSNKMLIYPYISIQKDFGYSDVTTSHGAIKNLVTNMFIQSDQRLNDIQVAYERFSVEGALSELPLSDVLD